MIEKLRLHIVGGNNNYRNAINIYNVILTSDMKSADLVIFTGGEDISPTLYGEKKHFLTNCNEDRDQKEMDAYLKASEHGLPILGICRG